MLYARIKKSDLNTNKDSIIQELLQLNTNDYQNRKGDFPKSGVPDSIQVGKNLFNEWAVTFSFKDTDETTALNWVKRKLSKYDVKSFEAYQAGDSEYQDDWVDVFAVINI